MWIAKSTNDQCAEAFQVIDGEIWKDVAEYEGLYQVSNMGRVKHLQTTIVEITSQGEVINTRKTKEYILKLTERKGFGYYRVGLVKHGNITVKDAHRLVAQAFCPKLPEQTEVHHIDRDRHNNNADNLVWLSPAEHVEMHREKPRRDAV